MDSALVSILVAVLYGVTSVSATVFTKYVMSGFGFRFLPFMMTLERVLMASSLLASGSWSPRGVWQSCKRLWPLTIVSLVGRAAIKVCRVVEVCFPCTNS